MKQEKNKPEKWINDGNVSVSIWKNTAKNSDGEEFIAYNTVLQRHYKDEKGTDQYTNQLRPFDCLIGASLLFKAHEWIRADKTPKGEQ